MKTALMEPESGVLSIFDADGELLVALPLSLYSDGKFKAIEKAVKTGAISAFEIDIPGRPKISGSCGGRLSGAMLVCHPASVVAGGYIEFNGRLAGIKP